jgi:PEGA domain
MAIKYAVVIPMAFVAALVIGAAPANAQHGGGGHMGGGGGGSHMGSGGHMSGGSHMGGRAGGHTGDSHSGGDRSGVDHVHHGGVVVPGETRGHEGFEHRAIDRRGFDGREFRRPFVPVRVIHPFHGPFFAFRPRFDLGFGLIVGYPVLYPWDYVTPYPYGYSYDVDPNAPTYDDSDVYDNSGVSTEQQSYGGMSFDITPDDATISVDGATVGTAEAFSPVSAPLTLAPGRHHVVIEKPGYQSMTFDSDIPAGQVIPYKGTMQPR